MLSDTGEHTGNESTNRHLIIVSVLFAVTFVASFPEELFTILVTWVDSNRYSHGLLAIAIIGWIVFQDREHVRFSNPQWWVLPFILLGALAWWFASLVSVQFIQITAIAGMFFASCLFLFGWQTLWKLRIPLASIVLILPIWNFLEYPLQEWSTDVVHNLLVLLQVPVFREEFNLSVPGGSFIVEASCSGLGFFLTSFLLGLFFIHYNPMSAVAQTTFILFAILLSLVSNWLRIAIIVLVGNYTNMDHPIVDDHLTFGWILFTLMLLPFFYIGHRLANRFRVEPASAAPARDTIGPTPSKGTIAALLISVALIPSFDVVHRNLFRSGGDLVAPTVDILKDTLGRELTNKPDWRASYDGADYVLTASHTSGIESLLVQYQDQRQGAELINVNNTVYDRSKWTRLSETSIDIGEGRTVNLLHLKSKGNRHRLISYWYVIAGDATGSETRAKLSQLKGAIAGDRSAMLIALASPARLYETSRVTEELKNRATTIISEINKSQ